MFKHSSKRSPEFVVFLLAALLCCLAEASRAQVDCTRIMSGAWSDSSGWSPFDVPNNFQDTARVAAGLCVILDQNASLGGLFIDSGDKLDLNGNGISLDLAGTFLNSGLLLAPAGSGPGPSLPHVNNVMGIVRIDRSSYGGSGTRVNNGEILVESDGVDVARFQLHGPLTLLGSGRLFMNHQDKCSIFATSSFHLTNGPGHTIHGAGRITRGVTNQGLIHADVPGQQLSIETLLTNPGTVKASSTVLLKSISVLNTSGTLMTDGGTIVVQNSTITAGALTGIAGSVRVDGTGTLGSESNSTVVIVPSGSDATIDAPLDTLDNSGLYSFGDSNDVLTRIFFLSAPLTVKGMGAFRLGNQNFAELRSTAPGSRIIQLENHTIAGEGRVLIRIDNSGVVSADVPTRRLQMIAAAFTNTGLMEAVNQGILYFRKTTIANAGGTIEASNGIARFDSITVNGGTITVGFYGVAHFDIGTSRFQSGATFNLLSGATTLFSLNGIGATQFSKVDSAIVSLNGHWRPVIGGGYAPAVGDTFRVMNYKSKTGDFAHNLYHDPVSGATFQLTTNPTFAVLRVVGPQSSADHPSDATSHLRVHFVSRSELSIQLNGPSLTRPATLDLFDTQGRRIARTVVTTGGRWNLSSGLSPGIYFLRIADSSEGTPPLMTRKLVLSP